MANTLVQDQNGNLSSKRVAMFIGLSYSMIMGTLGAFEITDPAFTETLVKGFLAFSAGMGGISVAEFFQKKE